MSDSATHSRDVKPRSEANRLGLDYRANLPRKVAGPIVDIHTHVRDVDSARLFFEAATHYGVQKIVSMSPLENVDALRSAYPGRLDFIAVPNWRKMEFSTEFRDSWIEDLTTFRNKGARLCKFWMAPPMRGKYGLTLEHEWADPVIRHTLELEFQFMVHIGDPSVWFRVGTKYEDAVKFGTKRDQYGQLEYLLRRVAPRVVIGAHMGGTVEDLPFLQSLLDRFSNYMIDTSATKWIVREVAWQPEAVRDFVEKNQDRILFGSDLVTEVKYDFDHYASRYWSHLMMWETAYRGESPIEDPDAETPPRLSGCDLPAGVLSKIYRENAARLGFVS